MYVNLRAIKYIETKLHATCSYLIQNFFCLIFFMIFEKKYFLGIFMNHHLQTSHCVKSVQIRSYFWFVFSCIRTEYREIVCLSVFSPNTGKYGPEITSYLDTFHAVSVRCYVTVECIKPNLLYKYIKKFKSSQGSISLNYWSESSKTQFFPVNIAKGLCFSWELKLLKLIKQMFLLSLLLHFYTFGVSANENFLLASYRGNNYGRK